MNFSPSTSSGTNDSESMDLETNALSSVSAPIIDLTHRWDDGGELLPGTSPSLCRTCHWNGDAESFWDYARNKQLTGRDFVQDSIDCASCELFRCILFKRAELEGKQVTEASCVVGPGFHVKTRFDDEFLGAYHSVFLSSETPKSDIDRYNIPRRLITSDYSLHDKSAEWASQLLAVCTSSHELCMSQSGDSFLPTRLINLDPGWGCLDAGVRLEDSSSVPSESLYVALSYCWGDQRPACITTANTLAQNKVRIPWETLPATFQDSMIFSMSVGIQYLWIDSICIIQEDEEDWQREAGRMYAVYKNSYLTLAALSGRNSTSGLVHASLEHEPHLVAELRTAQNVYPLYMRRAHYLDSLSKHKIMDWLKSLASYYPLLTRAWAYQERTVSPRVMFFTENELIFQCLEDAECECGAAQEWRHTEVVDPSNKTSIFLQTKSDRLKMKGKGLASIRPREDVRVEDSRNWEIASEWRSIVVPEYSLLNISKPRDRLPALGAIAEQFQRVRVGEAYLAGLWSRSLLDDLLWYCRAERARLRKKKAKLERPFSLPTWSWASLQCSVTYRPVGISVPKAEVLDANCSYAGENEFGVLQSSKLILRGRILGSKAICQCHSSERTCYFCLGQGKTRPLCHLETKLNFSLDMDQDGVQSISALQEVYFLEISESIEDRGELSSINWHFLLLCRDDQDEFVYTRLGTATFRGRRPVGGNCEIPDIFERAFEARSVLATFELR